MLVQCEHFTWKDEGFVVKVQDSVIAVVKNLLSVAALCFLAEMGRAALVPSPFLVLTHVTFIGRRKHFFSLLDIYIYF